MFGKKANVEAGASVITTLPNNTHKNWWSDHGLRKLHASILVGYIGTINSGYDSSLMNGLLAMPFFVRAIGNPNGSTLGIISAAYPLGTVAALPLTSWFADKFGRRKTMAVGGLLVIIGSLFQAFTTGANYFAGSRVIIGFGMGFQAVSAPAYVSEIAHPRNRSEAVALVNTCWYIGSIIAAWVCFGTLKIQSNWCWRVACLLQAVPCSIQVVVSFFVPESPRWLIGAGRNEEALAMLQKYHANGSTDDQLVDFEYREMCEAIAYEKQATGGTKYSAFLKTAGNRHRLVVLILVGLFGQWVGNGIISYYFAKILTSIGVTNPTQQAGLNGGLQIWNWGFAIAGGLACERLGRRFLWLTSAGLMLVFYIAITITSANYAKTESAGSGYATIVFLFFYFASYDIAFTGLGVSYPTEILPFALRTKGLSIFYTASNLASFFNQFVNPIALEALQWKYYIVYCCIIAIAIVCIYFLYPETKGRSLEEIMVVFDGPQALENVPTITEAANRNSLDEEKNIGHEIENVEYSR